MPPNTSSVIQPMDQAVIATFKKYYSRNVIQEMLFPSGTEGEVRTFRSKEDYSIYWKSLKKLTLQLDTQQKLGKK